MDWQPVFDAAADARRADAAVIRDVSLLLDRRRCGRASRSCSKARRARCSTSITAPIRSSPRRTRRSAASAPGSACRRRRSAACSAWPRRTRRASAKGRCRPSCPARWAIGCARAAGVRRVTGRPRRCGWYDAVAVRYAARINGLDGARAHQARRARRPRAHRHLHGVHAAADARSPSSRPTSRQLAGCEPVYESMPGWSAPTAGVREFDRLPAGSAQLHRAARRGDRRPRRDRLDRFGARRHDRAGRGRLQLPVRTAAPIASITPASARSHGDYEVTRAIAL